MSSTPIALIGAGGHGLAHRRTLQRLADQGRVTVVGLCDRRPVEPDPSAPLDGVPFYADHRELLSGERPDVVVICTPPHTHLPIALDVLDVGADLLLEKPPVMSVDEHRRLEAAVAKSGRRCQVGFQALGSAALAELSAAGLSGPIGVCGAWWRPDSYYQRTPWAGRRSVGGRPVLDGALVNPFAHALMQALVLAAESGERFRPAQAGPADCGPAGSGPAAGSGSVGSGSAAGSGPVGSGSVGFRPVLIELERYRSREIETDDCTFLRVTGADGRRITVAVTLASAEFVAGEIQVGGGVLEYPTDRLRLPGESSFRDVPGRAGLLENLLDHRDDPGVSLVAPLERTALFTTVAEAIVTGPAPAVIGGRWLSPHPDGQGQVVDGIADLVRAVAEKDQLPSECGVPWAVPAHRISVEPSLIA